MENQKWTIQGTFEDGFKPIMIADTEDECFEMLFEHEKEHGVLIEYYGSCGSEFITGKLADEIKDEQENNFFFEDNSEED